MSENINTVGVFCDDQWIHTLYQYQQDHQSVDGADQAAAFGLMGNKPSRSNDVVLNPKGCVSKPSRPRRSRTSRRTPTTLLNANAANFRALVQQFTGCPSKSISFAAHKGPLTLCFDRTTIHETTHGKNQDHDHHQYQPQTYSHHHHHHHQLHQQELVHDALDQQQQILLDHQYYNNNNNNNDDDNYNNNNNNNNNDIDDMFSHHLVISSDDLVWCGNLRAGTETNQDMGDMLPYVS